MFRWLDRHFDTMALTLVVWLCSLPLVALLVTPLLGLRAAAIVIIVLFFVAMAICWGICGWKAVRPR
jgi:hypothetical protein